MKTPQLIQSISSSHDKGLADQGKIDHLIQTKSNLHFFSLIAAKEVLSDKEMRQKFDQGEDPLDAEEERERQRHGNPFQGFHRQGGNPFGGGHQQFKFHFN